MAFRNQVSALSQLVADRIVGAFIATAESGQRWELSSPTAWNQILGFTGDGNEVEPAAISVINSPPLSGNGYLTLASPDMGNLEGAAAISLGGTATSAIINMAAEEINLGGAVAIAAGDTTINGNATIQAGKTLTLNGKTISAWNWGLVSIPIAASPGGSLTINHGLGAAPGGIIVQTINTQTYIGGVGGITASQFNALAYHRDGTATTVNVSAYWFAWR